MNIKYACVEDAAAIHELRKKSFGIVAHEIGRYDLPLLIQTVDDVEAEFSTNTVFKYVADGRIAGSVTGAYRGRYTCYVGRLAVDPEYQGRGIGSLLMEAVEEKFSTCIRFDLFTSAETPYTVKMYEKLGYTIMSRSELQDIPVVNMSKNKVSGIFRAGTKHREELVNIWEASVRATHDFITEEDIRLYKNYVKSVLNETEVYGITNENGIILGFTAVSDGKIEMLFIRPEDAGRSYGSKLLRYAIAFRGVHTLDVNEQNPKAVEFYRRHGFKVAGIEELDPSGKPYPILHLELAE
ncbi:MAG: GNAT family N-acetyltransferase [Rikenellaceae bacterium]|nr:GNAT family N-acetyltransferase [Rikenellaceae bacterium]